MEWVETTGRTIEEARERALDELGVDDADAEFEVIEDAQTGLFGRVRREARVRARVRPVQPRPKNDRRDRRRGGRPAKDGATASGSGSRGGSGGARSGGGAAGTPSAGATTTDAPAGDPAPAAAVDGSTSATPEPAAPAPRSRRRGGRTDHDQATSNGGDAMTTTPLTLDEQAERMTDFLEGLLDAFGYDGEVARTTIDDTTIELAVDGGDLGLLIGPKGQTLSSIQELARVASTRDAGFPTDGRVRIDVSGYRQRRREALERFAQKVAAEVKESGRQKVLEPMSPPDRKVVHDTVNGIDGVRTYSEGEDAARRVVIAPA